MAALPEQVRIDKFLWAARFFKTRQLAIDAVNAGRVHVNDERVKPAKAVRIDDVLLVRRPPYEWRVVVRALSEKRGSAEVAQALYIETADSLIARNALRAELKDQPAPHFVGRPTKRDRRAIDRFETSQQFAQAQADDRA
jgi:ribosome-associated heat shock protein Hsp15